MRRLFFAILGLQAGVAASPAFGQLMLPGAAPSGPSVVAPPAGEPSRGGPGTPGPGGAPAPKPVVTRAPSPESIVGHELLRNGASGIMAVAKAGAGLQISHIAFSGYLISRPAEVCKVDVDGGAIDLTPAPRHEGLLSFDAALTACPFSLDVLEGAALVRGQTCDFVAADCRVDPAGLWGPPPAAIGPAEDKLIEHMRTQSESEARASFRELLVEHKQDRARIKDIAREQASFSSIREEICRDYAGEDRHGFCAARITMAHAVALSAELHGEPPADDGLSRPKKPRKPKPKPVPPAGPIAAAPPQ